MQRQAGREKWCDSKDFGEIHSLPRMDLLVGGGDVERNKGWAGMRLGNTSTHGT